MHTRCPTCGGCGSVPQSLPPGTYGFGTWPRETCRTCGGSGWYWLETSNNTFPCAPGACTRCNGTGREPAPGKVTVTYVHTNK